MMNIWKTLFRAKIAVWRVRPGDVVVLEAPGPMSMKQVAGLRDQWNAKFPDTPCAVLSDGLHVGAVLRPEEQA